MAENKFLKRVVACIPVTTPQWDGMSDQADGHVFYKQGVEYANKQEWRKAVIMYNRALKLQRHVLGKNHIDCAQTLNDIGVALTHLGESYGAMTSLQEALWIRQVVLGDGHPCVVQTTCDLWKLLDQEREREQGAIQKQGESSLELSIVIPSTTPALRRSSQKAENARSA
eukprot:CAMPEP_0197436322 /NCGR_PEP_ID=MMETSP1175-20131217/3784_1 /TAXON_ID=1003142 /ORGANISM="Triceratium dubium, Strain CCMP147" /LENGTH=169 /DNA_ID=CAMNT_0042965577 /DNA_START=304 /DNA_END=810 /DNA_ORIENTATION=-